MKDCTKVLAAVALFVVPSVMATAQCVGQGAGSCQFVIVESQSVLDDVNYTVDLYDHACNLIGSKEDVDPGTSITSQLAYTVDIVTRGNDGTTYATFKYANGKYGKGISSYVTGDCSSGLTGCSFMRSAFPCPAH